MLPNYVSLMQNMHTFSVEYRVFEVKVFAFEERNEFLTHECDIALTGMRIALLKIYQHLNEGPSH